MKNPKIILLIAIVILLGGWGALTWQWLASRQPATTGAPQQAAQQAAQSATWKDHSVSDINDDDRYTLSAVYPVLQNQTNAAGFNTAVEGLVQSEIQSFRLEAAVAAEANEVAEPAPELTGSMLTLDYAIYFNRQSLFSMVMHKIVYLEGSQRPGESDIAFNYDLRTGSALTLPGLFAPNSDFLTVLSSYCTDDLKTRYGEALNPADGLAPSAENFANWNLTSGGVEFTFNNIQLGLTNAAGPQSVLVPYTALQPIIERSGPLGWTVP